MQELLKLARETFENYFKKDKLGVNENIKKKFSEKKACFVTLIEDGELRGCIGSLQAHQELWKDVVENVINAGFHDTRFLPLSSHELNKIKIEISVLSASKKLNFKNDKGLLGKIDRKMGIILKNGFYSATFLPQVWEQIPSKQKFLEQLSLKAGLNKDAWKDSEILFYRVESAKEK